MLERISNTLGSNIFRPVQSFMGLDLSDLSVKYIQLERKGKNHSVRSFASVPLAKNSIINGEIENPGAVIDAIKELMQRGKPKPLNTRSVICSIPEIKAFLRIIDIVKMTDKEMREAIPWELEENIPLAIDQVYYDCQTLPTRIQSKDESRQNVLIVAVAKKVIDSFIHVVEGAGLEVMGMEIESIAQSRCLLSEGASNEHCTLILDIGDRRTSLFFSVGNIIVFTSSIPLSSQMLTDAFASHFGVSQKEAEKIKIEYGIGSCVKKDPHFLAAEPLLENLFSQIRHSMDFVIQSLGYTKIINEILLCGGGANTKGLPLYLSKKIGIPVSMGNPWMNITLGKDLPTELQKSSIEYSTAIGLALQSMYSKYENNT
ncbi:MAG: type IV pilus assembly protein PilM [Candidatus Moraniibacteriota bacterium]|nr:MAG: type IV pilus assembly protein PilM [Candidatus Moranbacteria bacterium]